MWTTLQCWSDPVSFSLLLQKVCDLVWCLNNVNLIFSRSDCMWFFLMPGQWWSYLFLFLQKICDFFFFLVIVDWPFRVLPTAARTWFRLVPGDLTLFSFSLLLQKVRDLVCCLVNVDLTLSRSRCSHREYVVLVWCLDNVDLTFSFFPAPLGCM